MYVYHISIVPTSELRKQRAILPTVSTIAIFTTPRNEIMN